MKGGRIFRIIEGDALAVLRTLPDESVHCCITSPPYWGLRDYGVAGQLGMEATPELYVSGLVAVFAEVRRVLRSDGTCWVNLGDCYAGSWGARGRGPGTNAARPDLEEKHGTSALNRKVEGRKPKDLIGVPWLVAFGLQADGWYLRSDIIWSKPNPMPESVTDRPTRAHEYLFLLSKSERYFYNAEAIQEPGVYAGPNGRQKSPHSQGFGRRTAEQERARQDKQRGHGRRHAGFNDRCDAMERAQQCAVMRNKRSVWTIATAAYLDAHFATFPPALVSPCILAGSPEGGVILDPFAGAGTAGMVACRLDRSFIGIELNPEYAQMARGRILEDAPMFNVEGVA